MCNGWKHPAKRRKLDFTEEFVVVVGADDEPKKFTVAKRYLTRSSKFFQRCCVGPWLENETKTVSLPESDPEVFQSYIQWLQTGQLVATKEGVQTSNKGKNCEVDGFFAKAIFASLVELAILADMLMDVTFGNAVVDAVLHAIDDTARVPSPVNASRIYDGVPHPSGIRRLCVDLYVAGVEVDYVKEQRKDFDSDMVFDVMVRLIAHNDEDEKPPVPEWERRCDYHEHNEDVPKCKK